jgi:hypothetical protein
MIVGFGRTPQRARHVSSPKIHGWHPS